MTTLMEAFEKVFEKEIGDKFKNIDTETLNKVYIAYQSDSNLKILSMNEVYFELRKRGAIS